VAEKNRTKGASPTAVFRSPSRPKGGEAYTDLLCDVWAYIIIYDIINSITIKKIIKINGKKYIDLFLLFFLILSITGSAFLGIYFPN
jgi:hypothetical protein